MEEVGQHIHKIQIHEKYLRYIRNGKKTVCGIPLIYGDICMDKVIKGGDIVKFYTKRNSRRRTIYGKITSVTCNTEEGFFSKLTNEDLPNVKTQETARRKYRRWYGENNLRNGILEIKWEVVPKGAGC